VGAGKGGSRDFVYVLKLLDRIKVSQMPPHKGGTRSSSTGTIQARSSPRARSRHGPVGGHTIEFGTRSNSGGDSNRRPPDVSSQDLGKDGQLVVF
jgi:hypothetical protein